MHLFQVSLNYDIPSVDSVVVEISPWTLFCNCSGLCLSLMGEDHQEMCCLNHMAVATPPMPNLIVSKILSILSDFAMSHLHESVHLSWGIYSPGFSANRVRGLKNCQLSHRRSFFFGFHSVILCISVSIQTNDLFIINVSTFNQLIKKFYFDANWHVILI